MNKKGFTLVELIATIAIILLLGLIVTPKVMNIINENRIKGYKEIERRLEEAAGKYIIENYTDSSAPYIRIEKNQLLEGKYIDEIYDLKDKSVCDAYVNVSNMSYVASFKAILDCSNYDTILTKVGLNIFLNGGTTTQTFESSYDIGTVITLQNPTKNGSDFIGWEVVGGDATLNENVLTLNNVDTTIYAIWQNDKVNINYNLNGGTAGSSAPTEGAYGSTVMVSKPSKTGYTFTDWTVSGTGASIDDTSLTIGTSDITLTANWTINTYTITYNLDGGAFENEMPTQAEYGSTIILENPIKEGYVFAGWIVSGNNTILSANNLTIGDGDVTLTSEWAINAEFAYTGGEQVYTVTADGYYKLEVWGAQGGNSLKNGVESGIGGYGGYSSGTMLLKKDDRLYIYVGGKGANGIVNILDSTGGYNGGGLGHWDNSDDEASGGGGGATHVATITGLLSQLENNKNDLLLVSGGGGGGAWDHFGGHGGGIDGHYGWDSSTISGTQISGNAFGTGGNGALANITNPGGGGGGGFYGGGGGQSSSFSGAGGSGYIGNSLLTDKYMYCYNCTTSDEVETKTYTTICAEETPTENCAKKGNGYAKITFVSM